MRHHGDGNVGLGDGLFQIQRELTLSFCVQVVKGLVETEK